MNKLNNIVCLAIVFTLFSASCSAKIIPVKTSKSSETTTLPKVKPTSKIDLVIAKAINPTVKKKLTDFKKSGIEKPAFKFNIDKSIKDAKSYLGTKHKMGGTSKSGIDCSGLIYSVLQKQNIRVPHSAQEQAKYGKIVPEFSQLKKGDLVFYANSYKTNNLITHVGIYIGDNNFIHVSSSRGVKISKVDDKYYWGERFLFGTRINKDN